MIATSRLPALWLVSALVCGCGSKGIQVGGNLQDKGLPVQYDRAKDRMQMTFIKLEDGKNSSVVFPAEVFEDGSFEVHAAAGVPPGTYRIALQCFPYLPFDPASPPKPPDKTKPPDPKLPPVGPPPDRFQNRFAPSDSPIIREITSSKELVIDLAKPTE